MPQGPLKIVGDHAVSVALHTDVVVDITIAVVGEACLISACRRKGRVSGLFHGKSRALPGFF